MDRTEMPASGTHQAQPSAPNTDFGAPVLLVAEPAEPLSVTDLPVFTAEEALAQAGTQADAVARLIAVLAEFEILDHDTPAAALIQINNISGSRYGTLLLSADRIDEIVTALQAVLDGKSGGVL
jgi:hypothetical protein